jgi:quercetin dioxygenase-like cupin family protein
MFGVVHGVIAVGEFEVSVVVIDPHLEWGRQRWVGDLPVAGL